MDSNTDPHTYNAKTQLYYHSYNYTIIKLAVDYDSHHASGAT